MSFVIIPSNLTDIDAEIKDIKVREQIKEVYEFLKTVDNSIEQPITIDDKNNKHIKITPEFLTNINHQKKLSEFFETELDPTTPKKSIKNKDLLMKFGFGSRGKRGSHNEGHLLEKQIENDILEFLNGTKQYILPGFIEKLNNIIDLNNVKSVIAEGDLNKKRELKILNGIPTLGTGDLDIGSTISDITLEMLNGQKKYLSIKKGSTVQFSNIGITKYISRKDFINGEIANPDGKKLLEFFGIDTQRFMDAFNKHAKYVKRGGDTTIRGKNITKNVSNKIDFRNLQKLIHEFVGYGYIYCHLQSPNKWKIFEMTKSKMEELTNISSNNIKVVYPGKESKKVDVLIETQGLQLIVDFRNKMGGIYPHIMGCKYKFKKDIKEKLMKKRIVEKMLNTESRNSLKGFDIIRLSDELIGSITGEVAYGKAYNIEWENGKNQILGTSTIKDKKRYLLIPKQ